MRLCLTIPEEVINNDEGDGKHIRRWSHKRSERFG
jgi:hypothetical protein